MVVHAYAGQHPSKKIEGQHSAAKMRPILASETECIFLHQRLGYFQGIWRRARNARNNTFDEDTPPRERRRTCLSSQSSSFHIIVKRIEPADR